jgi:predicted adenylyl cyclase CyaB
MAATAAPDAVRDTLSLAYGQAGRVRKTRRLYHVGRTRVHLDRVEGLGDFVELEVVLVDGEPAQGGVAEAHGLMAALGIAASRLIDGAYVDLLAASVRGCDAPTWERT